MKYNPNVPKYYVAGLSVFTPNASGETWAKYTESEAIQKAMRLVEETGEDRYIVKVIKVVRRQSLPIVVEDVF